METWTTKDGTEIPIKYLEDSHVLNIIRYFFKRAGAYKEQMIESLNDEAMSALSYRGGDMAECMAHDEGMKSMELVDYLRVNKFVLIPDAVVPAIEEAKKRKLKMPVEYVENHTTIDEIKEELYER